MGLTECYENLIKFCQELVRTKSFSDKEKDLAHILYRKMEELKFDEVIIDDTGNVIGRIGNGPKSILFDSHMDTVNVNEPEKWSQDPFGANIVDGKLYGRGSTDMKCSLAASVFAASVAKEHGYTEGKTIYVTGTVCEEFCDGASLKNIFDEEEIIPDYVIICEPSNNRIALGHKGKGQFRIKTHGISAHGAEPHKGKNAVYEMAEIINRVNDLNMNLYRKDSSNFGTIVLSDISSVAASINAVPTECSIYLDRRLAKGETAEQAKKEMDALIEGKDANWEIGTIERISWKGKKIIYEPLHDSWEIDKNSHLFKTALKSFEDTFDKKAEEFEFWNFSTNAVTPISLGIPTIGFGCGDDKLAHMVDEYCEVDNILKSMDYYVNIIKNI